MAEYIEPQLSQQQSTPRNTYNTTTSDVEWLPTRSSTHPLVLIPQAAILVIAAMLNLAAIAAPTYVMVLLIGWLGISAAYALTSPVMVGCQWALALLAILLRRLLVGCLLEGAMLLW